MPSSRLLRVSSKNRASNSVSRYNVKYNTNDRDLHNVKRIALKSAIIPNTQYNINSNNNTFYMVNTISGPTYTIPVGQYTITTLMAAIQSAVGGGFTLTQDATTQLLTFTAGGVDTLTMTSDPSTNPMAPILGITTDSGAVASYTTPSLPDLRGLTSIYVASQALTNHTSMSDSAKNKQNIFCTIPVNVEFGGSVSLEEDETTLDYVIFDSHKNISTIDINLMDEDLNTLELNGLDWTLVFRVYE